LMALKHGRAAGQPASRSISAIAACGARTLAPLIK
jgi:hypothetical protein